MICRLKNVARTCKKHISMFVSLLFILSTITACGDTEFEVPELNEPSTQNEAYRVCEKGDIGNVTLYYGMVVPTEYCHFWKNSVNIYEIYVKVGDYVEAGQKIASCNTETVQNTIDELQTSIALEQSLAAKQAEIYSVSVQEQNYKLQGSTLINDAEGAAAAQKQIDILGENNRYDVLLSEHRLADLRQQLAEAEALLSDSYLYASVSGYVSYVKDISYSSTASESDNVVVIADYNDCYVELPDVTINSNLEKIYPKAFTYQNGIKYKLEYYKYQPAETLIAGSKNQYPNVRFKYENLAAMPECGSTVPVMLYGNLVEDVLIIGQDSLYEDTEGDYVYVKNGDNKEKRYVELGATDKSSVEVISGLSEGEKVYYTSESIMPENYDVYTVETSDYTSLAANASYTVEDTRTLRKYSDVEGTVSSVNVNESDVVSQGTLICQIQTNEGSAKLTELRNQIGDLKSSYDRQNSEYKAQIDDLYLQMDQVSLSQEAASDPEKAAETDVADTVATATDATATDAEEEPTAPQDPYLYEELSCQVKLVSLNQQIAELNYNYQLEQMNQAYNEISCNNDGTGLISVYAEADGTIKSINIREGKNIKVNDKLFNIEIEDDNMLLVRGDSDMALGETVNFSEKNGGNFTGTVVGYTGNDSDKYYVTTLEDKVYLTQSVSASGAKRYYVTVSDSSFYDEDRSCTVNYAAAVMKGVVILPGDMLYTEKSAISEKQDKYYVWKLIDGEVEKYYVDAVNISIDGSSAGLVISGLSAGDTLAREGGTTND